MVYEFEMWVMAHSAGVDVVLGTDFMISAGIRSDLFHGAAQLPNEIRIHWSRRGAGSTVKNTALMRILGRPGNWTYPGMSGAYRLSKRQVALETHIL
ncbi:hypothetical protein PI125_g11222 [Phytophthora idaei]|nr:hypothetical protein PI125_g11222 [Phytophthora idaei]